MLPQVTILLLAKLISHLAKLNVHKIVKVAMCLFIGKEGHREHFRKKYDFLKKEK